MAPVPSSRDPDLLGLGGGQGEAHLDPVQLHPQDNLVSAVGQTGAVFILFFI